MPGLSSVGRRQPGLDRSLVIRGDRCEDEGEYFAVLATSDLDIDALDPARKAATAAAFARMCHTLEHPMQLLVRIRPLAPPQAATAPTTHPDLDSAMDRYWTDQIRDGKRHDRQVYVALRRPTPEALDVSRAHTTAGLAALGGGGRGL